MDKPMIGIRQADGSFYEIMVDTQAGHKRLVLSAARTDQHGVRIDLYRSEDGTVTQAGALGSIALDDPEGLGYKDIEFHVDLDAGGQMAASAALPGQTPRTLSVDLARFRTSPAPTAPDDLSFDEFSMPGDLPDTEPMTLDLPEAELSQLEEIPRVSSRSDADILDDDSLALDDLDTLDDDFSSETSFDHPEMEAVPEVSRRSDTDILGDDAFAAADLDTLDDFSFDDEAGGTPETRGLDTLDDLGAPAAFDLDDLDAGFDEAPSPQSASSPPTEEWEKISLDDMEPMEFLDTGAEISAPGKVKADDSFRMEEEEPLELGDFESDLSDLPEIGDTGGSPDSGSFDSFDNDLDQDFLPPPALTAPSPWGTDDNLSDEAAAPAPKPAKALKTAKTPPQDGVDPPDQAVRDAGLDKVALLLSLSALSLLVLLILVLLFLNMIKSPQAPVIQPEVQRWMDSSLAMVSSSRNSGAAVLDLGAADPVLLETENILEVPAALRSARVSLVLEPGDTASEAGRRFGPPARVQGNQLSW